MTPLWPHCDLGDACIPMPAEEPERPGCLAAARRAHFSRWWQVPATATVDAAATEAGEEAAPQASTATSAAAPTPSNAA